MSPQQRIALAARIQIVAEREIAAIERVLDVLGPSDQPEAELTARTLASISLSLRQIAALNQPDEVTPPNEADDDRRAELGKGGADSGEEVTGSAWHRVHRPPHSAS